MLCLRGLELYPRWVPLLVLVKMASKTVTKVYLKKITRRDSQLLIFQDFFLFIFFDRQFRLFSFLESNTYSDAEISLISILTLWWARNNIGVIFLLCVHGFRFVHISRCCHLRWPKGLYLKFHFSQAFKFSELKLQV